VQFARFDQPARAQQYLGKWPKQLPFENGIHAVIERTRTLPMLDFGSITPLSSYNKLGVNLLGLSLWTFQKSINLFKLGTIGHVRDARGMLLSNFGDVWAPGKQNRLPRTFQILMADLQRLEATLEEIRQEASEIRQSLTAIDAGRPADAVIQSTWATLLRRDEVLYEKQRSLNAEIARLRATLSSSAASPTATPAASAISSRDVIHPTKMPRTLHGLDHREPAQALHV
jgi:hypothetical protein